MKVLILVSTLFLVFRAQASRLDKPVHILPDAPSSFYQLALKNQILVFNENELVADPIKTAIQLGEKNLNWLKYMNQFRDEANQLRLTKPGELSGIPITAPKKYSPQTVNEASEMIKKDMPAALGDVYYGTQSLPKDIPVAEDVYIEWARKIDRNYQTATRWKLLEPYMDYLKQEQQNDVRGYYFMHQITDIEFRLRNFAQLNTDEKDQFIEWMQQLCRNSKGIFYDCSGELKTAVSKKLVYEFYLKYFSGGETLWNSYFGLHNPRKDMEWTTMNPLTAVLPFLDPQNAKILDFLKVNIEDEWKWGNWGLKLDFRANADVHVEFQPGVTPHVNGLGGNTIVMDENTPLTEWDVQWTIRHEFGHVLGFTDCYVEFYDTTAKAIVNYQLDTDNLMCSRKGRLQETHYTTLKDSYLK